jgi:hypothetical protein
MLNGLNAFLMLNIPQSADNDRVMNTLFAHHDKASIESDSSAEKSTSALRGWYNSDQGIKWPPDNIA